MLCSLRSQRPEQSDAVHEHFEKAASSVLTDVMLPKVLLHGRSSRRDARPVNGNAAKAAGAMNVPCGRVR
jgi:hypothetical protein